MRLWNASGIGFSLVVRDHRRKKHSVDCTRPILRYEYAFRGNSGPSVAIFEKSGIGNEHGCKEVSHATSDFDRAAEPLKDESLLCSRGALSLERREYHRLPSSVARFRVVARRARPTGVPGSPPCARAHRDEAKSRTS